MRLPEDSQRGLSQEELASRVLMNQGAILQAHAGLPGYHGHQPSLFLDPQAALAAGLPAEQVLAAQLSALELSNPSLVPLHAALAGALPPNLAQPAAPLLQYTAMPSLHSLVLGGLPQPALNPQASVPVGPPLLSNNKRNEEKVRRTVYISDIDPQVAEAQLAAFFTDCGQLVDCRMCGDPNSSLRFAFIEFLTEAGAQQAQAMSGSLLGSSPIRVSPSKTAIVPVNNTYLPRSAGEREQVARTVYVANLDKGLETEAVREYFQGLCGPISRLRVLGDAQHQTKIAFIEFRTASSAEAALKCSGALLGRNPIRVSPSKTPVRSESAPRHSAALGAQQQQVPPLQQQVQPQQQQVQQQQHLQLHQVSAGRTAQLGLVPPNNGQRSYNFPSTL